MGTSFIFIDVAAVAAGPVEKWKDLFDAEISAKTGDEKAVEKR